ncbi:hypothetical protein IWZ01DRAFT_477232 [Phyllosticta capitalensis]
MCHDNKHVRVVASPSRAKVIEAAIAQAKIDARKLETLRSTLKSRGPSREATLSKAGVREGSAGEQDQGHDAVHQVDLDRARAPPASPQGPGRSACGAQRAQKTQHAAAVAKIAALEMQNAGLEATVAEKKRERAGHRDAE